MIDSHAHLYAEQFDGDREAMVARAQAAGITHVVLPGENADTAPLQWAMQDRWPQWVSVALGLHPEDVRDDWRDRLARLRPLLDRRPVVAVGEIGLDLYWDKTWRDQQLEALDTQLHWCLEKNVPFIIHCREALDELLWVMDNFGGALPPGVLHCFAGTPADVERVRQRGDFYFGVNGVVTFKRSTTPALLPAIGLDRLLLETDAPYLAPVPHRGHRNESAYLPAVCDFVARTLNLPPAQVSAATTANATTLFGL